ncbi:MAG: phage terminase small subunit P27 family [Neptuniibacter sp.]
MSRPKKPTSLHLLKGTARKDRMNPKEPKAKREKPRTPSYLSPTEKTVFKNITEELFQLGIITKADGMALELLCSAYGEYLELTDLLEKEGRTYEITSTTGDTMRKAHPAVAMRSDAWKRVKSMMAEFGMTPATRPYVSSIDPVEDDPLEAYRARRPHNKTTPPKQ